MPKGSSVPSTPVKVLIVGDSGTGKTGALASLAFAGYNLRVLDFDAGIPILLNKVKEKDPSKLDNIYYETCTDSFKNLNGRLLPKKAKAWAKGVKLLDNWRVGVEGEPDYYNLGPVIEWTEKEVLIIDSLTHAGYAAMRYHQALNGKLGEHPTLPQWGQVQTLIQDLLSTLYDESIRCNVVVNTHVDWRYEERRNDKDQVVGRELTKGYPNAPGSKLPERVGSYFNSMLQVATTGTGSARRHWLYTQPTGVVDLKNANPGKVKDKYPLDTGLADFFKDVRG